MNHQSPAQTSHCLRVVIADDNFDVAETLRVLLELDGHQVRVARNGLEAIDLVQESTADLVILDIGMPVINGYEAASIIRLIEPRTIVIAVSGYADPASIAAGRSAGFHMHFAKPADPEKLLRAVNELTRLEVPASRNNHEFTWDRARGAHARRSSLADAELPT